MVENLQLISPDCDIDQEYGNDEEINTINCPADYLPGVR